MRPGARIARLEQRRKMQATKRFSEACTCFPADEQPGFKWRAEAEMAAAVLCPLHGLRFHIVITRDLYRAFRFTSPTIRTAGRTNPHSIKKRCAPVSIGLCGLRRKRRILGTTACSFCVMALNCPAGNGYRLHTRIRDQNPSEVIGGECEQTLPSANEGQQAMQSGGCGRRSLRISR